MGEGRNRNRIDLTHGMAADVPSKPTRDRGVRRLARRSTVIFTARTADREGALVDQLRLFSVPIAGGRAPRNLTRPTRPGMPSALLAGRQDRGLPRQ